MAKEEYVSDEYVEQLNRQVVKPDPVGNKIDICDRAFGRVFSKIGQYFRDNW